MAEQRQYQIALTVFVGGAALVAAAIACGDIAFSSPDGFPHISLGLMAHGGGAPSSEKWKSALETGRLLEPALLDRPTEVRSPARVVR
jgi:hypothetical protein